jgi:hypothetical protein
MSAIVPKPAADIANHARTALRAANPSPFSTPAFTALQERIEQHIDELILESVRIMSRHQADTVSPAYVAQASENLVAGRRRKIFTFVGTLGGILLGAAVSGFVDMARASAVTAQQALTAGLLGVVGAIMIALQFARE